MKAGLHHRTRQVLASDLWQFNAGQALTSRCRHPASPRPLKSKDTMKDGGRQAELGGCYADVLTVSDCQYDGSCRDTPTCVIPSGEEQLLHPDLTLHSTATHGSNRFAFAAPSFFYLAHYIRYMLLFAGKVQQCFCAQLHCNVWSWFKAGLLLWVQALLDNEIISLLLLKPTEGGEKTAFWRPNWQTGEAVVKILLQWTK